MSKAVTFTDLHVHNYSQFDVNGSRLNNCLTVIEDVYELCKKEGAKIILFPGDLVDRMQAVPTVPAIALYQLLEVLIGENPEVVWIATSGNHDQATKSIYGKPGVSYLSMLALQFPKNFILVDNGGISIAKEVGVYGVPYYQHAEHFRRALEDVSAIANKDDYAIRILMIHQTPNGNDNPNIPVDTDVNDPLYANFDCVLCGHIHQRKQVTDKFFILGSPLHRDLGDENDEKGIYLLDIHNPADSLTFVSRKGKYPEFMRRKRADVTKEESANNFVIPELEVVINTNTNINAENFKSSLSATELITNYWEEQDGKDNELLKTGLEFII